MGNLKDYATSIVAIAPSPASSGTSLTVTAGEGVRFPTTPFYATVHPADELPTLDNAEKVQVTNVSVDTLTIVRAQGDTTAKSIAADWRISNALFKGDLDDKANATHTHVAADTTDFNTAVRTNRLDQMAAPTASVSANSQKITNLAAPSASSNAARKADVDGLAATTLVRNEVPSGTVNGSNTAFTTASAFATGSLRVYKNGVRMKITDDYTVSGQTITFVTAPATSTTLLVDYETTNATYVIGTNSYVSDQTPSGSVNGSNAVFTTAQAYVANTLEVFVNGLKQARTTDYAETTPGSGVFTFTTAPLTGDIVRVSYYYNLASSGNADTVDGYHADDLMPIGSLTIYAGSTAPTANWLFCYGQAVSRTTYATLFARLSTTYGVGDGSTTFNVPDLRGRVPAGQDDMGGSSANRLTNPGSTVGGVDGDVLGGTGGAETHVLTTAQLAARSSQP